jgi:hypothetical protein
MKPFMLRKAEGARPLTNEEIEYTAGGEMQDGPGGPIFGDEPPANTVGKTWRSGGESTVDSGPGY